MLLILVLIGVIGCMHILICSTYCVCRGKVQKPELSDVAKAAKIKKEKKDALANIDINNIAGKTSMQYVRDTFSTAISILLLHNLVVAYSY